MLFRDRPLRATMRPVVTLASSLSATFRFQCGEGLFHDPSGLPARSAEKTFCPRDVGSRVGKASRETLSDEIGCPAHHDRNGGCDVLDRQRSTASVIHNDVWSTSHGLNAQGTRPATSLALAGENREATLVPSLWQAALYPHRVVPRREDRPRTEGRLSIGTLHAFRRTAGAEPSRRRAE